MKKLNNKGFLLVETIVVATFTLTVLIALFLQFKNLLVSYNSSYNYNTVEGVYNLNTVKNYVMQYQDSANSLNKQLKNSEKPYLVLYNGSCSDQLGLGGLTYCDALMAEGNFKTVIFSSSNPTKIKEYLKSNEDANISEEMKNLIKRLDKVDNQNRLIAEFNDGTLATIVFGVDNDTEAAKPVEPTPDIESCNVLNQKIKVATEGDGIYKDTYAEGRCVYKGANPDNYITFNNETWRILSAETDGTLKIIKKDRISFKEWDTSSSNNWARPATLNTYLNNDYYNTLSNDVKGLIQKHKWGIGPVTVNNTDLAAQITSENSVEWTGNIGLISVSDFLQANTNITNCGNYKLHYDNASSCKSTNYLIPSSDYYWTISKDSSGARNAFYVRDVGNVSINDVNAVNVTGGSFAILPSLYLKSNITLSGKGTSKEPFTISEGGAA